MHTRNFALKPLVFGLFGFSMTAATCVSAADPLSLSQVPLQATGQVEPNLMILMDSSGSMRREVSSNNEPANVEDSRLYIAQTAAKTVVSGLGGLRVGLAQFNGENGATLLRGLESVEDSGVRAALLTEIDAIVADGYTPLGEAVADIGSYFVAGFQNGGNITIHPGTATEQTGLNAGDVIGNSLNYNGISAPSAASPAIQEYCQKNFILALTDGEPTRDSARTTYLSDYDEDGNTGNNNALDDVAKALYDIDWRPDLTNPSDTDHKNNITSYFIGFADPNLADNQLLEDAGSHGGGSYKFASDASSLLSTLNDAVNAITNSIGTQASVAFNSTSLDVGSVIYSAKFDTSDNSGRLYARSMNPDTGRIAGELWEAAEELSNESSASRQIITSSGGTGLPFVASNSGVEGTAHESDLQVDDKDGVTDADWSNRLDFLRGNTANEGTDTFRSRGAFSPLLDGLSGPKLLGDIVHSTPVYVGEPQLNWPADFGSNNEPYAQFVIDQADRTPMVYVGANDGMLHGFNASTGEEVIAYIPELVLSAERYNGLHALSSIEYAHKYYVDLTPSVSDVYINPEGRTNQRDWTTVLVGGLRGGGKGYFALDVTDPSSLTESNADDIFLWEFDGGNDTDRANLGFSYSEAQIAKLNNGKWAAIFGNGYNSENGVAGLFVVYIEDGADGTWSTGDWKFISTGSGTIDSRKNGLSSPRLIDLNGDRVVDAVYAGDLMGNMWAFDLSANSDSSWGVSGGAPLFQTPDQGEAHSAILAAPLVARNTEATGSDPNVVVLFGTGQYLSSTDLATGGSPGAFYAVWDNGTRSLGRDDLAVRVLENVGSNRKIQSGAAVDWTTQYGWYFDLETNSGTDYAAERVITAPTLRRSTLFFSTISPNPEPCASSGKGYLMALDFLSGMAGSEGVADYNDDGEIDAGDAGFVGKEFESCSGDSCGQGGTSGEDPGMPGQSGFIGDVRCTPGSSGDVICDDIDVGDEEREGRLSWEEFSPR